MRETVYLKMMGGVGHGMDVAQTWHSGEEYEFSVPGNPKVSTYTRRKYYKGDDVYYVWVDYDLPDALFFDIMFWHTEMFLGSQVEAQKQILDTSMKAARDYTNVIMVVGYAALFTLWTQTRSDVTPATSFWAAIFMCVSVMGFIAWEVFGMVVRSMVNIRMARVVAEIDEYAARIRESTQQQQEFNRRMFKPWVALISVTGACGLIAFLIMLVALMHGAWLQFLASSIEAVAT